VDRKDFKILVADDDEIARDVISALLSREGYNVVSARDGLEAIKILRKDEMNLVLTDLRMPGADGIEVLKYAVRSNPDIAVVILTAYGTLDTTLEAIKEGAYNYLTKPFKGQEIILVAARAYQMALLIQDNRELKRHLREMYRDIELVKTVVERNDPGMTMGWLERIERLKAMNVLSDQESELLKERLIKGNGQGEGVDR
jgi:DNA-binding NtrC family response regulator